VTAFEKLIAEVDKETRFVVASGASLMKIGGDNVHVLGETVQTAAMTDGRTSIDESKAVGSVKFNVVSLYLQLMGQWGPWLLGIVVFVVLPLLGVTSNIWIR
jgi:hypothetical protein